MPSMYIGCISCNGKCCLEAGVPVSVCINDQWRSCDAYAIDDDEVIREYMDDPITTAILFAGLEPFEQFQEMIEFVGKLRDKYGCADDVVIYTGYTREELAPKIPILQVYPNIIIKFGRFIPNSEPRYDPILGVMLASKNQYAEKIS